MKIWIFNHYAQPPDLPGGTRHYDLGRELIRRGHRVTVFASSFHHALRREVRLSGSERWRIDHVDGVSFVWVRTPPYQDNDWRRAYNMVAFMREARRLGRRLPNLVPYVGMPDVVVGSSVHLLAVLAAYSVAKYHQARFVMEVRDLWPQTIIDMGKLRSSHPIVKVLQQLEGYLYHRAEAIIVLGPQMETHITGCGVDNDKITWIPNGVELHSLDCTPVQHPEHDGFRVMYLGAHSESNALGVLIRAAAIVQARRLRDINFVLVGDGPAKESLMRLAQSLGLENVRFQGPVPKSDVPATLSVADVLVLTKHPTFGSYSGSILKLFDYMAAAKPVVYSAQTLYDPTQRSKCGFTVEPGDAKGLAEAVIKLYEMPAQEREAMGRRGREYVEKHHSIAVLADKLEAVLTATLVR